jgi:hypothetical protein
MLIVTDKQKSKGTYDRQVKSMVSGVCRMWDDLEDLERLFELNLNRFKRLNTFVANGLYRLVKPNDTTIEVWHINTQSQPDRLLVEITYKPK